MAKKTEVEKIQVIPAGEDRWAVPSSSENGVSYEVTKGEDGRMACNCMAGLRGQFCKHKRAVMLVAQSNGMADERRRAEEIKLNNGGKMEQKKQNLTKHGYQFGEVTSAVQKSIRRGDEREAIYWALELYETAPHYLVKRLLVIASEDVGMADPQTVMAVNVLALGWAEGKRFSWYMSPHQVIQMVMMLCRAGKSTEVEDAIAVTQLDMKEGKLRQIPEDAIDMHTQKGKDEAKAKGLSYDDQCRQWYTGRLKAGILMNEYTMELEQRMPQWFNEPKKLI